MIRIWICLSAALVGLPLNADSTAFERRSGITCGVRGGEAHLVWTYNDTADPVGVILWYYGTQASGTSIGSYIAASDTFTSFTSDAEKISFASPVYTAGFNRAKLTFNGLEVSDAGNYTTVFRASGETVDISVLEVAEPDGLGTWEICVDDTCKSISDPLILPASSEVKLKFIKNMTLTCDMEIDVKPSVGDNFTLMVPGATAEHTLADTATLVAAGSLSFDLAFGKNGEVFSNDPVTDTIPNVSVESESTTAATTTATTTTTNTNTTSTSPDTPGGPNRWNDLYVIPIVLGVCILVIIVVVVVVVRRRKKMETGRPHPQDRSSGVSVGASAAGMPPGGQPRHKAQPNPQSGAPSGDMAYKVGYVDPDAPALFHDDRYDSGFGNTGYAQ